MFPCPIPLWNGSLALLLRTTKCRAFCGQFSYVASRRKESDFAAGLGSFAPHNYPPPTQIQIGLERPRGSPRLSLFLRVRSGHSPKTREKLASLAQLCSGEPDGEFLLVMHDSRLAAIGTTRRRISYVAQKNAKSPQNRRLLLQRHITELAT